MATHPTSTKNTHTPPHDNSFSSVVLCADAATGEPVVVKAYATTLMAPRHAVNLRRELAILADLAARRCVVY